MQYTKLDPISLLKLFEVMDTPFDKPCVCGEKHRLNLHDFDLNSVPTRVNPNQTIQCQTHLRYLQQLPSYGFSNELDTHLAGGNMRLSVIKLMLMGIKLFTGVRVKK